MDAAQLQLEHDAVIAQLSAANAQMIVLVSAPKSNHINTGQTTTIVNRTDIAELNLVIKSLRSQEEILDLRLNGGGVAIGRPLC